MENATTSQGGSNAAGPPDPKPDPEELESFQSNVFDLFVELSSAPSDELFSIPWLLKIFAALSFFLDLFIGILPKYKLQLSKSPMKEILYDYLERTYHALDFLNAVRDGIVTHRLWNNFQLDIAVSYLNESQGCRAKGALDNLLQILDGQAATSSSTSGGSSKKLSRAIASILPQSWSASDKDKLQLMVDRMVPPKKKMTEKTSGLASTVFTMSFVLLYALWILLAAIPCEGKGPFNIRFKLKKLKGFKWGAYVTSLHNRIMKLDTTFGREMGLLKLKEIDDIKKWSRCIISTIDSATTDEQKQELGEAVTGLGKARDSLKEGLDSLMLRVEDISRKLNYCATECQAVQPNWLESQSFHRDVFENFEALSSAQSEELLSIPWLHKVIAALSFCLERFMSILWKNKLHLSEYPVKKMISLYLWKARQAHSLLNGIRDGIHDVILWNDGPLGDGVYSLNRLDYFQARRDLNRLQSILGDYAATASGATRSSSGRFYRLTVSSSNPLSWSASHQLQLIESGLTSPSGKMIRTTHNLAIAVFTMSFVLFHVCWILLAAIPCQGRRRPDIRFELTMLRGFEWGNSVASLHTRIMELDTATEGRPGLKEIQEIEKCSRRIIRMINSVGNDELERDNDMGIGRAVSLLVSAKEYLKEGLDSLKREMEEITNKVDNYVLECEEMLRKSPKQDH